MAIMEIYIRQLPLYEEGQAEIAERCVTKAQSGIDGTIEGITFKLGNGTGSDAFTQEKLRKGELSLPAGSTLFEALIGEMIYLRESHRGVPITVVNVYEPKPMEIPLAVLKRNGEEGTLLETLKGLAGNSLVSASRTSVPSNPVVLARNHRVGF